MNFYYKVERWRGFIPSDKARHTTSKGYSVAFETGYWDKIIGKELTDEWQEIRHEVPMDKAKFNLLLAKIDVKISEFLKTRPQADNKSKAFLLNFNMDGIDCRVNRWNWK